MITSATGARASKSGESLFLREIRASDATGLRAFHARCSPETQYQRFLMYKPHLSHQEAEYYCNVDMRSRGAFVASSAYSPQHICGIGHWDAVTRTKAEIAFLVEDAAQGLGLGRRLLYAVVDRTRDLGFSHLTGSILVGNAGMRHLFQTSGYTFWLGAIEGGVQSFSLTT